MSWHDNIRPVHPGWVALVLLGMFLRLETDLMDPIHEQMHAAAVFLTGGEVTALGQSYIRWRGGFHDFILFAGYVGEVVFYGFLGIVFRHIGPFFVGAGMLLPFIAGSSSDFSKIGPFWDFWNVVISAFVAWCVARVWWYRYVDKYIPEDRDKREPREASE